MYFAALLPSFSISPEFMLALFGVVFGAGVAWGSMKLVGKRLGVLTAKIDEVRDTQTETNIKITKIEAVVVGTGEGDGVLAGLSVVRERVHGISDIVQQHEAKIEILTNIVQKVVDRRQR